MKATAKKKTAAASSKRAPAASSSKPSDPPEHLSAEQAAIWRATVGKLSDLSAQRLALLEAYSIARARWLAAEAHLREHGDTITLRSDKGEVKDIREAPQLKIARAATGEALKIGKLLGLSWGK